MQRRLVTTRRPYTRCFRCHEYGHIARECPNRWNRRNRGRGQCSSNNRAGDWGSRSYETSWSNATANDTWDTVGFSHWGAVSAPAQSSGWEPASTNATDANDSNSAATGVNDGWGGNLTVSDREWPTSENTTSFELHFDIPDDEPEWFGFDDLPSDSFSSDEEDLTVGSLGSDFNFDSSTSRLCPTRNQNNSSRNSFRCYNCGEVGHIARRCPLKSKPNDHGRRRLRCDICSKYGHESNQCWYAPTTATTSRNSSSVHNPTSRYRGSSVKNRPPTPARLTANNSSSRSSSKNRNRGRQRNDSFNQNMAAGHTSYTTPSTSRQTFHRNVTCWNCNEIGHRARDCYTHNWCPYCGGREYPGCKCYEVTDH